MHTNVRKPEVPDAPNDGTRIAAEVLIDQLALLHICEFTARPQQSSPNRGS